MPIKFISANIRVLPDGRVSSNDAAKYLDLSPKTLANWRVMGKGPRWIRMGWRIQYFVADLDKLIEKGVTETS